MPIYEYQCQSCGTRTEIMQKISDPPPGSCDDCGAEGELRKLVSAPAFQFKGDGWYITDYARKDKDKDKKTAGDDGKKETKSSQSKDSAGKDTKSSGSSGSDTKKSSKAAAAGSS